MPMASASKACESQKIFDENRFFANPLVDSRRAFGDKFLRCKVSVVMGAHCTMSPQTPIMGNGRNDS